MATPTEYSFSKAMDIPSLTTQIQASTIVTVLDYITVVGTQTNVWFKDVLSSADQTTLNTVVTNYVYIAPPSNPPTKVIQLLGSDSVSICPFGTMFNAPLNQTTTCDLAVNSSVYLRGGTTYSSPGNIGDTITVQIVDKNNITGAGAGAILATYVNNWYVIPQNINAIEDISLSQEIIAGLFIRFIYTNSSPVNASNVIVNLLSYQGTP